MHLFLTSIWAVIVVLGVMVFIHELGHFLAAKYFGVRVERFSLGFPPRLFGIRRGDTDYCVGAIPLGGFVKMAGENPMEERTGDPREFLSRPRWQRFVIALAGPAMNILFAIVVLTGVYMVHFEQPVYWSQPARVGYVGPDSPAAAAGIQPGDLIVRIGNDRNPTWADVQIQTGISPNRPVGLAVQRDGKLLTLSLTPKGTTRNDIGEAGWAPDRPILVGSIEAGMPLAQTPVQPGDIITGLNGQRIGSIEALMADLKANGEKPIELSYTHDGVAKTANVTPKIVKGESRARLGFLAAEVVRSEKLSLPAAFRESLNQNAKFSYLIVDVLKRLVTRQVSLKQLEGPISIARESGQAAMEQGWIPLLTLMVAISLNLGIFNLLPIPILDGGVILLLLIEGGLRRDISLRLKERIYQAAFLFLVIFAAMVIYNDLMKTIPGLDKFLP
jgi:regulator of sigma E protease